MLEITDEAFKKFESLNTYSEKIFVVDLWPKGCGGYKVLFTPSNLGASKNLYERDGYSFYVSPEVENKVGNTTISLKYGDFFADTELEYTVFGCGQCYAAATNGGQCSLSKGS